MSVFTAIPMRRKGTAAAITAVTSLSWLFFTTGAKAEQPGEITYSGQTLFRVRTGAGGYTAEQRAEAIRERLGPILSLPNLRPEEITVQQKRPYQEATIYVRDRLLVTVDKGMAQSNGNNEPGALARQWAERMRRLIPTLSVKQQPQEPPQ